MKIKFCKYKGTDIRDCPDQYLHWFIRTQEEDIKKRQDYLNVWKEERTRRFSIGE
jgi:hypothetical protein